MSSVQATGSSSAVSSSGTNKTTSTSNGLDGDAFMQLLLAQLRNQNPMEPMKNEELMSQMTQLNSLQELQKIQQGLDSMGRSYQILLGTSLIGKEVTWSDEDGNTLQGVVKSMAMNASQVMLHIGDKEIPLESVTEVKEGASA
jgi:flagellar basal-body rod modification protein FlgD